MSDKLILKKTIEYLKNQEDMDFIHDNPNYSDVLEFVAERIIEHNKELLSLVDGAYEIVELWEVEFPSQNEWKNNWMKKAKEFGASPSL